MHWTRLSLNRIREIERVSGCGLAETVTPGPNAYRRYERRALEETIQLYPDAVMAIAWRHRFRCLEFQPVSAVELLYGLAQGLPEEEAV